jgi:hypothetical protein
MTVAEKNTHAIPTGIRIVSYIQHAIRRIVTLRLDQFSKGWAELRTSGVQQTSQPIAMDNVTLH